VDVRATGGHHNWQRGNCKLAWEFEWNAANRYEMR